MEEYIFITKFPGTENPYRVNRGRLFSHGKSHMEALRNLLDLDVSINGTLAKPLIIDNMRFDDKCDEPICPCHMNL